MPIVWNILSFNCCIDFMIQFHKRFQISPHMSNRLFKHLPLMTFILRVQRTYQVRIT